MKGCREIMNQEQLPFGIGILAWKAHKTLENTLSALTDQIPASCFLDAVVFCQEITDEDRAVAQKYGFRAEGNSRNVGILGGIKGAVSAVQADVVLFLECDCLLIEGKDVARQSLAAAADDLLNDKLDVVRLRHLKDPGEDYCSTLKYLRYWSYGSTEPSRFLPWLRRMLRPEKATRLIGESCRVCSNPEEVFPNKISRLPSGNLCVDSASLSWTNQSIMFCKAWFLETIIPYAEAHPRSRGVNGFPDLEKEMNCRWWRKQGFKIGWANPGLFTHYRVDRPDGDQKVYIHKERHLSSNQE
ncbi:hypothetical protein ACFLQY_04705 [Verrucomicrobiota bacterium]